MYPLPVPARRGLLVAFLLVLGGAAEAVGHARPGLPESGTLQVVTPWHFRGPSLVVPDSLPVGTVVAATLVPSGGASWPVPPDIRAGLWGPGGPADDSLMAGTGLAGLMVRFVPEKAPGREWRQGGIRIELVKTGAVSPGVLTRLAGAPEYRLWRLRAGHPQVLLREWLVMDAPLTVAAGLPEAGVPGTGAGVAT